MNVRANSKHRPSHFMRRAPLPSDMSRSFNGHMLLGPANQIPSITWLLLRENESVQSAGLYRHLSNKTSFSPPKKEGCKETEWEEGGRGYFREGLGEVRARPVWGALKPARLVTQHWPQVERKIFLGCFFATALALNTLLLSPFDKKKKPSLDSPPLSLFSLRNQNIDIQKSKLLPLPRHGKLAF